MEGLPFALVAIVSVVLYKNLGIDNTQIAFYTSLFTLPWALKPALAPLLETFYTKRRFILATQSLIALTLFALAACIHLANFFSYSLLFFFLLAFFAALHDINADGLYITNLDTQDQAYFIGIRSCCYQLGKLIGQGGLVALVGFLLIHLGKINTWQLVLVLFGLTILGIVVYHVYSLPVEKNNRNAVLGNSFKNVFHELIKLPHLGAVIIFTLAYNIPDAQLAKMVPLFLLDDPQHGGLGLSIMDVGIFYGGVGVIAMLIGITLSGVLLAKFSLKKCLLPITIFYGVRFGYWRCLSVLRNSVLV
jgi:MFS transporter, PAT family, beta-lactamase induction signal transducer AmpG